MVVKMCMSCCGAKRSMKQRDRAASFEYVFNSNKPRKRKLNNSL